MLDTRAVRAEVKRLAIGMRNLSERRLYEQTVPDLCDELDTLRRLLVDLIDPEDCWFDHHGGCQAHGFLEPEPGEECPHGTARRLVLAYTD